MSRSDRVTIGLFAVLFFLMGFGVGIYTAVKLG